MEPGNDTLVTRNDFDKYLVDETLFVGDLPSSIRETDIKTLLQHCMPVEMYIRREDNLNHHDEVSYLRFSSRTFADRAYTLYHGFKFTNGAQLQLRMYRTPNLDPQAQGDLLKLTNLASENVHRLYDIFRPFGPLQLCISTGEETAIIQYFDQADSKNAISQIDGMTFGGKKVTITSLPPGQNDMTFTNHTSPLPTTRLISAQEIEDKAKVFSLQQQQETNRYQKQLVGTTSVGKAHIDFTNLYVKNMDPLITNEHLETLFSKFGRIISARVISHPTTQQSRGYGFVSFSNEEEAARALESMNGEVVFSKPLYVSFHETKKGRNDNNNKNSNYTTLDLPTTIELQQNNINSTCISPYQPHNGSHTINLPRDQDSSLHLGYSSTLVDTYMDNTTIKLPMKISPVIENATLNPSTPPSNTNGPSLDSLATGVRIQHEPDLMTSNISQIDRVTVNYNDLLRMDTSPPPQSIRTDSTLQRHRLTKAVIQSGHCDKDRVSDVVDLLLTLTRKERSLCLFNTNFLREKVDLALDSLDIFDDDDDDTNSTSDAGVYNKINSWEQSFEGTSIPRATHLNHTTIPSVHYQLAQNNKHIIHTKSDNNYLLPSTPPSSLSTSDLAMGPLSSNDIDALIASFSTMSLTSQKQTLGDIMWPYVKPLAKPLAKNNRVPGFSSKVLVYLLDNLPLNELAHGINNISWLKAQIESAVKTIYPS
ncbi:hypothetical protein BC941DRAFT_420056 [Chlamydoabsidia padenii]|nr:hypothetical protein BC941DRAFT_420056 [Chlamydoabsidia padenii]